MSALPRNGKRRKRRRLLRLCRVSFLLLVLWSVSGLVYLNQVGVPSFLHRPLVDRLRARGLALEFSRLRLQWYRGLIAEQVTLGLPDHQHGPRFSSGEVVLALDWWKLAVFDFQIRSLELRHGQLALPLDPDDPSAAPLFIGQIQAALQVRPDDRWELTWLTATGPGVQLNVTGTMTHASALRNWTGPTRSPDRPSPLLVWRTHLRRAREYAERLRFSGSPELNLAITCNALDPARVQVRMQVNAPEIQTTWGTVEKLSLHGAVNGPSSLPAMGLSTDLTIEFQEARTPWGEVGRGRWQVNSHQTLTNLLPAEVNGRLSLSRVRSPWGETPNLQIDLHAYQSVDFPPQLVGNLTASSDAILGGLAQAETNRLTARVLLDPVTLLPAQVDCQFTAVNACFPEGTAGTVDLHGHLQRRAGSGRAGPRPGWAWWAWLEPFELSCDGQIGELTVRTVTFDPVKFSAEWQAPQLHLTRLLAECATGQLDALASVNVDTRETEATAALNLDVHSLDPLLTPKAVRWLGQFGWAQPPQAEAVARLVLPAWTNAQPDWRGEVLPSLRLNGRVQAGVVTYRGVPADSVQFHFAYSNRVWHLPDLVAGRPEGNLEFAYTEDTVTRDYHFKIRSRIDPQALRPLIPASEQKIFNLVHFTTPPSVIGDVRGRWHARERIGIQAQLEATQFVFREEPVHELSATIAFTNGFLSATGVQLRTGDEWVTVPGVGFRLSDQLLSITNATARVEPLRVGRAIGPKTALILAPYRFLEPPRARVDGSVNVKQTRIANMRFEITGGPFHYWRFRVPEITGTVHWLNDTVTISNLHAPFYQGRLNGQFRVDVSPGEAVPFQFEARVSQADFHQLMVDLHSPTNRLVGELSLDLAVTRANARNWQSWEGLGQAELRNGFLWDIPLFGIFSPVLNSIVPGLGKSRISGATTTFTITNSIIRAQDLELRAPLFRLAYRGAVDFQGRVNARVEARLLRDAWMVGPLVSLIFSPLTKLFEYQVGGTLDQPQMELIYIPKPLQAPLNPRRTLRELFEPDKPPAPLSQPSTSEVQP